MFSDTTVNVLDEVRLLSKTTTAVEEARLASLRSEFRNLQETLSAQAQKIGTMIRLVDYGESCMISSSSSLNMVSKPPTDRKHQEALLWLLPVERRKLLSNFQATQYSKSEFSTGTWFLDGTNYRDWQVKASSCLWLQGPGKL
jgi:hypothetical protein